MESALTLANKAQKFWDKADAENRPLTPDERYQVEQLLERVEQAKSLEAKLDEIDGGALFERGIDAPTHGTGPGDQFIQSKGYQAIRDPGSRGERWSSGAIELDTKGTLVTTPGTALTPAGYVPGVVETLYQRPYLADLLPNQQAPGNPVRFVSETTATNAAAATAEGGLKPESTLAFGETSEPIRKIATFLPISDEMLEDAPMIQAYINQRLSLFVKQVEEAQLLLGSGTAPALQGFVASGRAIGTFTRGTADDNATAIFKCANGVRGSSFLDPDTVVLHPTNWQTIRLAKDNSGQFMGGGPFQGAYGTQTQSSSSQFSADTLWGMRVVVTSAITVGTALLGSFGQGAALFRKGGLRVEASNSHGTYFQTDLVAIRAEMREALAVYRPSAFCAVVNLA